MRAFPIGVNTWVWVSPVTHTHLTELVPRIAGWGFNAVELPVEQRGDWEPATTATLLAEHGLSLAAVVAVLPPGRELVATDEATVRATQEYLRHCVDLAVAAGAPAVAGPAYASVGRTWRMDEQERAQVYAELRQALAPVVDYAGERGVRIAVEPLNRYETSVINTVEQALDALGPLPAEGCGIALDIYHMNIEERDLATPVRAAGDRVAHVQVCANDRGTPGADHLDWPAFLRALDEVGYSGALCIESFTAHNASIAVAASVWRPLASSQDALAVGGLGFLRRTVESLSGGSS